MVKKRKSVDKYPWEKWNKKGKVVLRHGKDYFCTDVSFLTLCRNAAKQLGISYHIHMVKQGVIELTVTRR